MEFLRWMENISYIKWVAESDSIWGFPIVLVFHTVGLALVVGTNAIIDLRVLGAGRKLPISALTKLSRSMWIGFFFSAASGAVLFMMDAERKSRQVVFFVKLGLIVLSFLVTILIQRILTKEGAVVESDVPPWGKILAAMSLMLWAAVIAAGRLMALS